jgi:hypothetical protein
MPRNYYKSGEWNIRCMVCDRKIKSGSIMKRWDGLLVCPDDYENRHPMDFLRARAERISVPFTYQSSFDQFDGPNYPPYPYCTPEGSSGIAGWATAGCARPSLGFPNGLPVTAPEIPDEPLTVNLLLMSGGNWQTVSGNNLITVTLDD